MNDTGTAPAEREQQPPTEFKPVVKGIAYCLLAAAVLASGYITFHLGYEQGYGEASASEKVSQALNSAAVRNLTCFMQSSTASDEDLEAMVQNPDAALSWIKDEQIRREAEWLLAQSLLQRGRVDHTGKLLSSLFRKVPKDSVWARRSMSVGDALCESGNHATALAFYNYAAEIFAAAQSPQEQVGALSRIAAASIAGSKDNDALIQRLTGLLHESEPLGHAADSLRTCIQIYLGGCHRALGDEATATRCYDDALRTAQSVDPARMSPAARVSCGAAYLVKGDSEKAESLLQSGERELGHSPADSLCRVLALRDLAILAEQRGEHLAALSLLNRAEGVAEAAVPRTDLFWPCFYDQRGWIQLLTEQYAAALDDFSRALASSHDPSLRAQSLEGSARCQMGLEHPAEAVRLFNECLSLRTASLARDKDSLARVWILLAQAYEPQNKPEQVAAAYGQALSLLPQNAANYRTAAFGQAKALGDAGLWQQSLDAWNALLPQVKGEPDDLAEVQDGISACHVKLQITPEPQVAAQLKPAAAPATQRARSTKRGVRQKRHR